MKPVTLEQMQEQWVGEIARGEETAYSKKLLPKHFYILQYYPDMLNLENKEYESVYAVEC
jgi:AAA+ superfamily predicted ATPase